VPIKRVLAAYTSHARLSIPLRQLAGAARVALHL
jgi:hypothetical protein